MSDNRKFMDLDFSSISVKPSQIKSCFKGVGYFFRRYARNLSRRELREDALMYAKGLMSDLPRKTGEPIARFHGVNRFRIQNIIGKHSWDEKLLFNELHNQIVEEIGDKDGILIVDGSGFPKKGSESCGVKRQWCGRLGKIENCQVGVFTAYAGMGNATLVEADLFLPRDWARDRWRRKKTHVPITVRFRSKIKIALDQIKFLGPRFPHSWILGDDEFGRPGWFRRSLAQLGERYLLEVPGNTLIRPIFDIFPNKKKTEFQQILIWAKAQPKNAWTRVTVASGHKGPIEVYILGVTVNSKFERKIGPRERLLITRTVEFKPDWKFWLSNASEEISLETIACVSAKRHLVEECFQKAKGESGLAHYETRSWKGWYHHLVMSIICLWYLTQKQRIIGKKNTRNDNPTKCGDCCGTSKAAASTVAMDSTGHGKSSSKNGISPFLVLEI